MTTTNQFGNRPTQEGQFRYLTSDEYDRLQEIGIDPPGFVQDFIAWGSRQTDASRFALQGGALLALSIAAGDGVVVQPLFGSTLHLNVYILLLGPSTTVRKSTVLDFARKVLPKGADGHAFVNYEEDFSIQALAKNAATAAASGRPTLVNVDEVAGLFKSMKASSHFLNGLDALLLRAFDHSPVKISRTGYTLELPDGAFVSVLAANTPEAFRLAITEEDLTSGLMPRFLLLNLDDVAIGNAVDFRDRIADREAWLEDAEALRKTLVALNPTAATDALLTTRPEPKMLEWSEESLDRLFVLDAQIRRYRGGDDTRSAIDGRALVNILKTAGLNKLSRSGVEGKIELDDVLRAMLLVEETTHDLTVLSDTIGVSATTQILDTVEAKIRDLRKKGLPSAGYLRKALSKSQRNVVDEYRPGGIVGILTRLVAEKRIATTTKGGWIHRDYAR